MDSNRLEELAAAARALAADGLVEGGSGNVSVRGAGDQIAMTATGVTLATAGVDDLVVVNQAGDVLSGAGRPSSEAGLHLALYERYDCGAVVHTHAPAATALSLVLDELPLIHYEQLLLGGTVRVAPFETFGSAQLAQAAADAIEGRTVALLANHGTVALGADLEGALRATRLLEWLSHLYLRAASIGTPRTITQEQAHAVVAAALARGYGGTQGEAA